MTPVPSISVLMSVWNGLPYVRATVESILGQTHADFEFIIVDNVSTDGTRDYLREAAAKDPRIRLFFNETNLGHSGGLNRGLAECRAPWIARMDADDIALPTRFERQRAFVADEPRLGLTSCLAHYIDSSGRRIGKTFHLLKTPADFDRYMATGEMIGILHPGAFMNRELVQRLGGYREPYGAANDIDLWCRIAEAGSLILVQQEYLMEYRVHPGQISAAKFLQARTQYEWTRACARARRSGQPEPTWDAFVAGLQARPWPTRLNHERKTRAKYLYREAGVHYACGHRLGALWRLACACALQPGYAFGRVRNQFVFRSTKRTDPSEF
jgi:glycosyltransferase involved in cell wall biosynthesis